jgi:hypothetical protein
MLAMAIPADPSLLHTPNVELSVDVVCTSGYTSL